MMKKEFETLLGQTVSDEDYKQIEFVYTFYDEKINKRDIVQIYKAGGMNLINDMMARSKDNQQTEIIKTKLAKVRAKKDELTARIDELSDEIERVIEEFEQTCGEENKLELQLDKLADSRKRK